MRLRQSTVGGVFWVVAVSLRLLLVVLSGVCFCRGREYGDRGRDDQSMGPIVSAGTGDGHTSARRTLFVLVLMIDADVCGIPMLIVHQTDQGSRNKDSFKMLSSTISLVIWCTITSTNQQHIYRPTIPSFGAAAASYGPMVCSGIEFGHRW